MATTIAMVRALIQDNDSPTILTDDDIQVFIGLEENAFRCSADAARAIAAKFADRVDMGSGSSKLSLSSQSQAYLNLAASLDKRAQSGAGGGTGVIGAIAGAPLLTGISVGDMATVRADSDRFNGIFHRGRLSNPPGDDPSEGE